MGTPRDKMLTDYKNIINFDAVLIQKQCSLIVNSFNSPIFHHENVQRY